MFQAQNIHADRQNRQGPVNYSRLVPHSAYFSFTDKPGDWHQPGEIHIIGAFAALCRVSLPSFFCNQVVNFMTDKSHQCVIIGIAGASASGKSLIASTLYRELRDQVGDEHIGVIPEDCYYKDQSHLSMEDRVKTNYDHPSAMDHSLLFQHLQMLKQGKPIELPVYSYVEHTRMVETVHIEPKKVIILEGILLLTDARLRQEMNFSIFVDTPLDICLMRRIKRDVNERGRSMDSVMAQYQKTVRPMFLQFIDPSKQYADIIVPRGGKNRIAIDILKAKISQFFE